MAMVSWSYWEDDFCCQIVYFDACSLLKMTNFVSILHFFSILLFQFTFFL